MPRQAATHSRRRTGTRPGSQRHTADRPPSRPVYGQPRPAGGERKRPSLDHEPPRGHSQGHSPPATPAPEPRSLRSSKPAGRCSPSVGRFDSCAASLPKYLQIGRLADCLRASGRQLAPAGLGNQPDARVRSHTHPRLISFDQTVIATINPDLAGTPVPLAHSGRRRRSWQPTPTPARGRARRRPRTRR